MATLLRQGVQHVAALQERLEEAQRVAASNNTARILAEQQLEELRARSFPDIAEMDSSTFSVGPDDPVVSSNDYCQRWAESLLPGGKK